jgi:hypothetical protein
MTKPKISLRLQRNKNSALLRLLHPRILQLEFIDLLLFMKYMIFLLESK